MEPPDINETLKLAVESSEDDPQMFALFLTATVGAWVSRGIITEAVAVKAITLLHRLHPDIDVDA